MSKSKQDLLDVKISEINIQHWYVMSQYQAQMFEIGNANYCLTIIVFKRNQIN